MVKFTKKEIAYYDKEPDLIPKRSLQIQLTNTEARTLCRAIAKKYNLELTTVSFRLWEQYIHGKDKGYSEAMYNHLSLEPHPFMSIVCHEMAHIYQRQKTGTSDHNKELLKITQKIIRFALAWANKRKLKYVEEEKRIFKKHGWKIS